jgi:hypothetical protein
LPGRPCTGELTQGHGDPALAQDVLHRLAEPQIDPQRQRGEQFRQPGTRLGSFAHPGKSTHRPAARKTSKDEGFTS